ncbi:MAG: efflux RND transporter permease subunit [Bacteroidetes bacterium]|nr:efflux RND transporter permease subunit [Bacteroidota bacterium]
MNITELAIKRPSLIVVIFAVLTFLGIVSFRALNYELLPKFSQPVLVVITPYPGASPSEVENLVTKNIEDAVSSLEQIDNIQSTSYEGVSVSVVIFNNDADMNKAVQNCQLKLNNVHENLPRDVHSPIIYNFSMDDMPIMRMGVTADVPSTELYDIVKQKIRPMLSTQQGVSQVELIGGEEREIRVSVDNQKLEARGISILHITQAVQASNIDFPTGKIKGDNNQMIIRLSGKFTDVESLKELVVSVDRNGSPVKLKDIADVLDTKKETKNIYRINGVNSLGINIYKQPDGNEVKVSESVKAEIKKMEEMYKGIHLKVVIANDTSDFTLTSANAVQRDLLLAILLVALVMLVFLHSLRNSFIVMVAIPASLISTFIGMSLLNFSLNIISMVAIALVIGILVDDSIVVLENIYRHLEKGKNRRQAAIDGRNEISFTALSITMVDVVVFLPIAVITSMISGMLRQFTLVVVISTLLSLFVSFTLTPLLASRFAKVEHYRKGSFLGRLIEIFEKWLERVTDGYGKALAWSLKHKLVIIIGATVILLSSLLLPALGFIGSEFISLGDRGEVIIQLELPKDATIEQNNLKTLQAEQYIMKLPEVTEVFATVGITSGFDAGAGNAYKSEIYVKMVAKEKRKVTADQFAWKIKEDLTERLTGVKVRSSIVSLIGTSDMDPVQFVLAGSNMDTLMHYAKQVESEVKKVPGTAEVKLTVEEGNPEISVKIDRDKMAKMGLNMSIVGATMQNAFTGNTDSKFSQGVNDYDINITLDQFNKRNINDISNLTFTNTMGQLVRLNQFASLTPTTGTTVLQRYNRQSSVTVSSQVVGRPVGSVGEDIVKRLDKVKLPADVSLIKEGDLKYQSQAFGSMFLAFLASILFVYLIMVALYDSYIHPFVVLFSIPLAIVGALIALALAKQSLTIFSILGIIMLVGLVGKNAILLVDFTNQLKREGMATVDALIQAGRVRLRPILMTTFSMIFGMMPIALASGAGSEWKNGIAIAIIGGLTSSLLLTLVMVPVMYYIFDKLIERSKRRRAKRRGLSAEGVEA